MNHAASELFQTVAEFDIFHAIDEELFVKSVRLCQERSRRGYVSGVVVRKIQWTTRNAIGIKNSSISQVPQKGIVCRCPWSRDRPNNRRSLMTTVIFEMRLSQI